MKKFITIAASVAFLFTGMTSVSAQTAEETIAELMAMIATLQQSIATTSGASMLSDHDGINLQVGVNSARVSELQACMNAAGYNTGVVDGAFGVNTSTGVMSFQASQGLVVDGIVGVATTPAFQAACPTVVVVEVDEEDEDDSSDFDTDNGDEASLEKFDLSSEDDAEEGEMTRIATVEFDAEDGDFLMERLDLTFDNALVGAGADNEPWDVFETLHLAIDGDVFADADIDDEDDWNDENNPSVFRLSGLDQVVEDGDTLEFEIWVTTQDNVDAPANANWSISIDDEGIRGVDTAGITQYIGDDNDSVSFGVDEEGGDEEIKIKSSNNDLDSSLLSVDEDDEKYYEVFVFELEAEENDITVDTLELEVILGNVDYNTAINDMKVEMNGNEVDDFDVYDVEDTDRNGISDGGEAAFDFLEVFVVFDIDEEFEINGDDEEEVTVSVEFKKADQDNDGIGDGIFDIAGVKTIQVGVRSVDGEGADDVDANSALDGKVHTLTLTDAEIANMGWATSGTDSSGVIDFTFTVDNTDSDEDFDVLIADVDDAQEGAAFETGGTVKTVIEGTLSRVSGDSVTPLAANAGFTVDEGDSATFRVRYIAAGAGVYEVSISEVAGVELDDEDELSPTLILEAA
jgi:hypothetical protein